MPRKSKAAKDDATKVQEGSRQLHGAGGEHQTKADGEKKHRGGHLMDGIFAGLGCRTQPPIIDGIVRGVPKGTPMSVAPDTMSVMASASKLAKGDFGAGLYPEGK